MRNRQKRRAEAAKNQKAPDPFKIYMAAERYRIADKVLRDFASSETASSIAGPTMVMSAFASELYLKCLYTIETGRAATGHEIRTLFLMLSDVTREEIEREWDEYSADPPRVKMYEAIERIDGTPIPRDLRWSLKQGNDAFVALRYIHELDSPTLKFVLGDLHNMLRKVILTRRPGWVGVGHRPMQEIKRS